MLEKAVNHVLDSGYRTGDIMSEGCTEVSCSKMGELLMAFIEKKTEKSEVVAA
jgi:3-isopropylmalate dehydrogenase